MNFIRDVRIRSQATRIGLLTMLVLFVAGSGAGAAASESDWDLRAAGGLGTDNNVFRRSVARQSGGYVPFNVRVGYERALTMKSRIQADLFGLGRLYSRANEKGDNTRFGFDLNYDRRLFGGKRGIVKTGSLDAFVTGRAEIRHTQYYSRSYDEVRALELKDRYNARRYWIGTGLTFRYPRRTRWSAEVFWTRRDYLEDYAAVPGIDALDYDHRRATIQVNQRIGGTLFATLRYALSQTDYDEWTARDVDGNKVAGQTAVFRYDTWSVDLYNRVPGLGGVGLEVVSRRRQDRFQGYYDYDRQELAPRLGLDLTSRLGVVIRYSYMHTDYINAHVNYNPVRAKREDFDHRLRVSVTFATSDHGSILGKLTYDDVEEADPIYTYTRLRMSIGYSYRL